MSWGTLIFITGASGAGKTTLCQQVVGLLRASNVPVTGFLSLARYGVGGEKIALELEDLNTEERYLLAEVHNNESAGVGSTDVGPFVFSPDALVHAEDIIAQAPSDAVLIVDELGPLELEQARGWVGVLLRLRRGDYRAALIVVRPELFLDAQRTIGVWRPCHIVVVTTANRDGLADQITTLIRTY